MTKRLHVMKWLWEVSRSNVPRDCSDTSLNKCALTLGTLHYHTHTKVSPIFPFRSSPCTTPVVNTVWTCQTSVFLDAEWLHQDFILQCHSLAATRTLQCDAAAAKALSVLTVSLRKSTATLCALKALATSWRSSRASEEPPPICLLSRISLASNRRIFTVCLEAGFSWAVSPDLDEPGISFFIQIHLNCKLQTYICWSLGNFLRFKVKGVQRCGSWLASTFLCHYFVHQWRLFCFDGLQPFFLSNSKWIGKKTKLTYLSIWITSFRNDTLNTT